MTTLSYVHKIRFGTWNIKTLYQTGRLAQAGKIMEAYSLAFLGMSEVRWNGFGQLVTTKGHLMLWSGMPNENDPHHYGVGMLIDRRFRNTVINHKFVSERIMSVRFKSKRRNLSVVQCYAPTQDADDEVKLAFYDQLNKCLAEIPKGDLKLMMGDFNAKVGSENKNLEHVMGKHGVGVMNSNGELLVELCGLNELKIGGTLFPHKLTHKVTWVSPDSQTQNQIDHICFSADRSNCLHDVRNKRGADIGSDHHLLVGVISLQLQPVPIKNKCRRVKYKTAKLKSEQQRTAFCDTLREKLAANNINDNIQRRWDGFKAAVTSACEERLGRALQKKEDFISSYTWALIDKRSEMKHKINSLRSVDERKAAQLQYSALDKRVRRSVREDKKDHIDELASKAEYAAAVNNMKDLYDITKKIAGTAVRRSIPVKNRDGVLLNDVNEQLQRWREHFQEVLNLQRDGIEVTRIDRVDPLPIRTTVPSRSEIIDAIKAMKNGKAAGVDNITAEVLKADARLSAEYLHPLILQIWEQEEFPADWLHGLIIKLPKKGDLTDCNNWRGITILCVSLKILMWIILQRMLKHIDPKLRPEQAGFRAGRSCIDQINSLRMIIEQSVEMRSPLYLLFVDYEKAFDSVDRDCIWAELYNLGVPGKIISLIRTSYEAFKCSVLHDGLISDSFPSLTGVRQGCLLSPLLFIIVMDAVSRRATENRPRGIVWDPINTTKRLESLDYADDRCELAHRQCDMQQKLDDLDAESIKVGLKINASKTKEMRINADSNLPLTLQNQPVERVNVFQYLGSMITEQGGAVTDVVTRIQKARGAFTQLNRIWRSTIYSVRTKMRIFKTCVVSVLLYGCETWLVTEEIKRKLQVFVNRCLRRILRIFWPNTISNQELWDTTGMKEINNEVRKRKFGWIGHTLRKPPDEVCNRALVYNPQGSRRRGRPCNTWRRSVIAEVNAHPDFERKQINDIWDLRQLADRRTRWKQLIDSLCPF